MMKQCSVCGAVNPDESAVCAHCGSDFGAIRAEVVAEGDKTGGLIPYKNPAALAAYYLGILSGLPLIGLPFGIAAFLLGLRGLKARNENPVIKGSIHAGIGVGCGCFFALLWSVVLVIAAFAVLENL